jgi:hypothetical protein
VQRESRAEMQKSSELYENLENCVLPAKAGKLLIVKLGNSTERGLVHEWAKINGFWSEGAIYSGYGENYNFKCKDCGAVNASNQMNSQADYYSTGECCGTMTKCPNCDETYYNYEDPENSDIIRYETFNCVIISQNEMDVQQNKKKCGKIHNRAKSVKINDLVKQLNSIHYWQIKVVDCDQETKDKLVIRKKN